MSKFTEAATKLVEANELFSSGVIKPVQHSDQRQAALGAALMELASEFGVTLRHPLQIDANGEFSIVAMPAGGKSPTYGAGPFGEGFANLLNGYSPRTGVAPGAMMTPDSGWCRMNHFGAEKMVLDHLATQLASTDVDAAVAPQKPRKMRV